MQTERKEEGQITYITSQTQPKAFSHKTRRDKKSHQDWEWSQKFDKKVSSGLAGSEFRVLGATKLMSLLFIVFRISGSLALGPITSSRMQLIIRNSTLWPGVFSLQAKNLAVLRHVSPNYVFGFLFQPWIFFAQATQPHVYHVTWWEKGKPFLQSFSQNNFWPSVKKEEKSDELVRVNQGNCLPWQSVLPTLLWFLALPGVGWKKDREKMLTQGGKTTSTYTHARASLPKYTKGGRAIRREVNNGSFGWTLWNYIIPLSSRACLILTQSLYMSKFW